MTAFRCVSYFIVLCYTNQALVCLLGPIRSCFLHVQRRLHFSDPSTDFILFYFFFSQGNHSACRFTSLSRQLPSRSVQTPGDNGFSPA